jgi:hypothetical protein
MTQRASAAEYAILVFAGLIAVAGCGSSPTAPPPPSIAFGIQQVFMLDPPSDTPALNHHPAWADVTSMGRLVFYPVAIGLFVLLDMALRAHGH